MKIVLSFKLEYVLRFQAGAATGPLFRARDIQFTTQSKVRRRDTLFVKS